MIHDKSVVLFIHFDIFDLPGQIHRCPGWISSSNAVSVYLAGEWRFKLDPQSLGFREEWFKKTLHDLISLPGTCEEQGYGVKKIKPATGRLTKLIRYEGDAWYQRVITDS